MLGATRVGPQCQLNALPHHTENNDLANRRAAEADSNPQFVAELLVAMPIQSAAKGLHRSEADLAQVSDRS